MPKVYIDGIEYETQPGHNMLEVALDHKLDLPYFCWHAAMGSVGACRQCAIKLFKDESDTKGKIVMACMTPAVDNLRASIKDPEAVEFRRYVIEWLMTNHPHDCPVCDEGGECHLQDMTAMCEHVYRRFRGKKRTYTNQYLGPFVNHEMNRCIQCYRCVRFYRDLAGGRDFDVLGSRNHVYFGRAEDGVLESEFSGNLVEVCPTGVFTDKSLKRHYTRKWDLQTTPSVCIHCGLGCNTIPGERYGEVRRVYARYNSEHADVSGFRLSTVQTGDTTKIPKQSAVSSYFICDRGRYGYEFASSERRIKACSVSHFDVSGFRQSTAQTGDTAKIPKQHATDISWNDAIEHAAQALRGAMGIVGIGSPRASLEANYALKKLVGDGAFSNGLSRWDHEGTRLAIEILKSPSRTPSLAEVESADVIVILGADPTNEAPMLDFAVRQAIRKAPMHISRQLKIPDWDANAVSTALQGAKGKLYVSAPWRIKLEELAVESVQINLAEIARNTLKTAEIVQTGAKSSDTMLSQAATDLKKAGQPLIITSILAGTEVLASAAKLAKSLQDSGKDCWLSIIVPEANSIGVGLMDGMSVDDALDRVESGEADTLIVLENDLARRVSPARFEAAMGKVKNLIVLDCIETATTRAANIVLPAPSYFECDGTFVNNESRAQRFYQVFVPSWELRPVWRVMQDLGLDKQWAIYEDVLRDLAKENPIFMSALEAAPPASWRSAAGQKIAREAHRFSGRAATSADKTVFEPEPPRDPATPFTFSMEGDQNPVDGPILPRYWWPGWNSVNSVTKFQTEVNGPLYDANPGKRLIEPSGEYGDFMGESMGDGIWIMPRPAIFGSEELSGLAPGIAELSPPAEITMRADLAEKLDVKEGELVDFDAGGKIVSLPCRLDESIAADVATVPANIDQTIGICAPIRLNIERAK